MPTPTQWASARARGVLNASLRSSLGALGYEEVETPCLVHAAGMEPHIDPLEVEYVPQTDLGARRRLYLHTSPEYAMKRLLADGSGPIFQISRVFRNGELSPTHNPEFTLLELYRPHSDYHAIMADLEQVLAQAEGAVAPSGAPFFRRVPYERVTVAAAVRRATGVDLRACASEGALAAAARECGARVPADASFEDAFFHLFLQKVEPSLGQDRPTFLTEYPAPMASLARLKPGDESVAERVELYGRGLELGNGFSELTDAVEQRRRLLEEQDQRRRAGRVTPPLDERFLDAVGRMPPSGGIAVGLDRALMLMLGARAIDDVLLFPGGDLFR